MGLGHSPSIIVDGLIFHIDPNNPRCYSGSGNTIYNLVNPSIGGTFVGFTANPIDNTETRSLAYNGSTTYQEFYPIEPTRFTVSVWFKATGAPSLNDIYGGTILASSPQYYISFGMLYRWTTNTVLFVQSQNGEIISASAPANKIVNAVYTYDGTNAKLYIDGVLASTVPYTTDPQYPGTGNRNLVLGRWGFSGYERYFNGNIYQASIYNRALSASEILQNYNAKRKKFYPEENIVSDGLVLHIDPSKNTSYPGTGNTIYDLSGFGNTGTLTNGPILSSSNGGSIVFDGSNDYVDISNLNLLTFGTSPFTIDFWIYITSGANIRTILSNYSDYNTGYDTYFYLGIYNYAVLSMVNKVLFLDSSGNFINNTFGADINTNQWTHVVFTRDGNTLMCYKNGLLVSSTSKSNNFSGSRATKIGGGVASISTLAGSMPSTKIYNRALSAAEVQQNYNATKGRFLNALPPVRDGLILELDAANRASYPGTGNTWYDLSGSNYHATLTNGPTFSGLGNTSNLVLDGTNDFIISNVNKTIIGSSLTITFLFSTSSSSGGLLEISDSQGTGVPWIYLKRESSSQIYWYLDGDYRLLVSLASNENALMSITYSNNLWSMYKNGVLQGTSTSGLGSYGGNNLRLGVGYHGNTATKWNLFTINNRALSAYEIKQNFDYYRTRYNI